MIGYDEPVITHMPFQADIMSPVNKPMADKASPMRLRLKFELIVGDIAAHRGSRLVAPIPVAIALGAPLAGGLTYIGIQSNISPYGYGPDLRKCSNVARVNGYPGVSQEVWDQCQNSNNGGKVKVTQTAEKNGVTPECMNLAALFTEGGTVYPCGSACLQYEKLSDVKNLKDTIQNLLE